MVQFSFVSSLFFRSLANTRTQLWHHQVYGMPATPGLAGCRCQLTNVYSEESGYNLAAISSTV